MFGKTRSLRQRLAIRLGQTYCLFERKKRRNVFVEVVVKALKLTPNEWVVIRKEIDKRHPRSVTMVRWKMKEVLGFTAREHTEWIEDGDFNSGYKKTIHLDFYDESKRTMFLLKYGDWIGQQHQER